MLRLIYDRSLRRRFCADSPLGLDPALRAAAEHIDRAELEATAAHVHRSILRGGSGDGEGLLRCFPRTLAIMEAEGRPPAELAWEFLASPELSSYRVLPYAGIGVSLPEAFHAWLSRESTSSDPRAGPLLDYEFLTAQLSLLTVHSDPSFQTRSARIHRAERAWWALLSVPASLARTLGPWTLDSDPVRILIAATDRGLVRGPVGPAAAIALGVSEHAGGAEVSPERVDATRARLTDLGVLP